MNEPFISCCLAPSVSHGRMWVPTGRNSVWRYSTALKQQYGLTADYNDNQGFCGGFAVSRTTQRRFSVIKMMDSDKYKENAWLNDIKKYLYQRISEACQPQIKYSRTYDERPPLGLCKTGRSS